MDLKFGSTVCARCGHYAPAFCCNQLILVGNILIGMFLKQRDGNKSNLVAWIGLLRMHLKQHDEKPEKIQNTFALILQTHTYPPTPPQGRAIHTSHSHNSLTHSVSESLTVIYHSLNFIAPNLLLAVAVSKSSDSEFSVTMGLYCSFFEQHPIIA